MWGEGVGVGVGGQFNSILTSQLIFVSRRDKIEVHLIDSGKDLTWSQLTPGEKTRSNYTLLILVKIRPGAS